MEDHIVHLYDVTWKDYERLLEIRGEHSAPRITYLEGALEILSPSQGHEGIKSIIACLLEAYCVEKEIRFSGFGSWTIKKKKRQRGAEPDECYVFGSRRKKKPDLAIEVVWTTGRIDKLDVYRKLGVREVWYWRKGHIQVYLLEGENYEPAAESECLPDLDLELLIQFVDRETTYDAIRDFLSALRASK